MDQAVRRSRFWPNPEHSGPVPVIIDNDEDILVIRTDRPNSRHIGDIVRALLECQPWPRRILIASFGEPADLDFLEALNSIVLELSISDRVAVFDAGRHLDQFGSIKTIIYSPWWFTRTLEIFDQHGFQPVPFEQRTTKFSCLNRIARTHRVKLAERIIEEGLLDQGLVTCGSATPTYNFDAACKPENVKYFPLDPLMDLEPMIDPSRMSFNACVPNHHLANCIINVVSESSYERLSTFKENWEREMTTEKTIKTYLSQQIPIWFAPTTFVNYQSVMGFDTFDDLVDHSYDNIVNPYERIDAVAAELKRLAAKPIEELRDYCVRNQHRFLHNQNLVRTLAPRFQEEAEEKFKNWMK